MPMGYNLRMMKQWRWPGKVGCSTRTLSKICDGGEGQNSSCLQNCLILDGGAWGGRTAHNDWC